MEETTEIAVTEEQITEVANLTAAQLTPVKDIEKSLANFLKNAFEMVIEEDEYQKKIKEAIIAKLPDMKASELIALATSAATNKNDAVSKLVAPSMQLLAAAQQNEITQKREQLSPQFSQTNIRELTATSSTDVLQGLKSFSDMLAVMQKAQQQTISND